MQVIKKYEIPKIPILNQLNLCYLHLNYLVYLNVLKTINLFKLIILKIKFIFNFNFCALCYYYITLIVVPIGVNC